MESLYRKYRPLTFESVVGQQHIVSTLEHAVTEGRLSHAYLFCGPRGTGKTTMARILAKSLLCQKSETARAQGASGCMPDGNCPECEAIAAGAHPDVYELDAASRTGVDNVREEIINSVSFAPVRGAYKVYIIDEVHMLTTAAFNALLKTLEEPPAHVVFVLCTTDPQKLPETILSRCQRFDFHRISNDDLVGRMRFICEEEGFGCDAEALEIVAKHARGGMRDALSTLEQLSVFGDGAVRTADARALLGEVASTVLAEFACKIAVRDTVGLFGLVRAQVDEGNDLLELTRDLVAHMRDVYTAAIAGPKQELFDGTPEEISALVEEAKLFEGSDRLARTLTVLDDAALEMRSASDPRLVLEIALTRLARPESDLTLEALAERIARLEAQLAAGVPSGPMGAAGPVSDRQAKTAEASAAVPRAAGSVAAAVPNLAAEQRPSSDLPWSRSRAEARPAHQGNAAASSQAGAAPASRAVGPSGAAAGAGSQVSGATRGPASSPSVAMSRGASAAATDVTGGVTASSVSGVAAEPTVPGRSVPAPAAGSSTSQSAQATSASPAGPAGHQVNRPVAGPAPVADTTAHRAVQSAGLAPAPSSAARVAAAGAAETPAVSNPGDLHRKWSDVVKRVVAAQPSRGALLQSARAQSDDGSKLTVGFPAGSSFAIKMVGRPDSQEVILPIVCAVFGKRAVEYVMEGLPAAPVQPTSQPSAAARPSQSAQGPAKVPDLTVAHAPVPSASPVGVSKAASAIPQNPRQRVSARTSATSQAGPSATPQPASSSVTVSAASQDQLRASHQSVSAPAATPAAGGSAARSAPSAPPVSASIAPAVPTVDQASGPTVVPEPDVDAQRKAWEDEQVPYDDATIAAYTEDDEIPPFDVPGEPAAPVTPASASSVSVGTSAPASSAPVSAIPAQAKSASAPVSTPTAAAAPQPQASTASSPSLPGNPFGHAGVEQTVPETEEEAKAMLGSIFGAGIVFKDVDE